MLRLYIVVKKRAFAAVADNEQRFLANGGNSNLIVVAFSLVGYGVVSENLVPCVQVEAEGGAGLVYQEYLISGDCQIQQ